MFPQTRCSSLLSYFPLKKFFNLFLPLNHRCPTPLLILASMNSHNEMLLSGKRPEFSMVSAHSQLGWHALSIIQPEGVSRTRLGAFLDTTPIELVSFMTTNGRNHCLRKKDVKALSPRVCLPTLQSTTDNSFLNPQNPFGLQMFADVFFVRPIIGEGPLNS
jgi:hypothetical protein